MKIEKRLEERSGRYALCGFSSARIGENLRLKILCTLRLGAKNFVEGVLLNILPVKIQPGVSLGIQDIG